jgi:hypothetical protein
VLALARWIREEGVFPVPDGMLPLSPRDLILLHSTLFLKYPLRVALGRTHILDSPASLVLLARTFLGYCSVEMLYSPYISPASECVHSVSHEKEGTVDVVPLSPHNDLLDYCDEVPSTPFAHALIAVQYRTFCIPVPPKPCTYSRTFQEP